MFIFCAAICFGVMLGMGGVALAEDELIQLRDPDAVFPESEPPFIVPLPPVEFPVAPVIEDLGDMRVIPLNPALFPSNDPRMMEYTMPTPIPIVPEDGDYGDAAQALLQVGVTFVREDLVNELTEQFPGPASTLDQIGNFIEEHPYASTGLGAGALILANVGAQAGLEEYGDNLNMDSVTIPIPAYENPDFTIPFFDITIGLFLGVEIQQNVTEPDWIRMNGVIRY